MNINFLTINDGLIASFFDYLKREDMGKPAQPHLIVGGSGSGKTFLLRKLSVMIEERLGGVAEACVDRRQDAFFDR